MLLESAVMVLLEGILLSMRNDFHSARNCDRHVYIGTMMANGSHTFNAS